jgi:hypothetical protein
MNRCAGQYNSLRDYQTTKHRRNGGQKIDLAYRRNECELQTVVREDGISEWIIPYRLAEALYYIWGCRKPSLR